MQAPLIIGRTRVFQENVPYEDQPVVAHAATDAQNAAIEELRKTYSRLEIVIHEFRERYARYALVALSREAAVWISPTGAVTQARALYPFCVGNPTIAHCLTHGYCRRNISCTD